MATTYAQAKVALREIADRIIANRNRLSQVKAVSVTAEADLAAMPTQFGTIISDITASAQAAPGNAALQALKGEADMLVAEFGALNTAATAMKTATAAVNF